MKKSANGFFNIFDKSYSINAEEKFFLILKFLLWMGLGSLTIFFFPIFVLEQIRKNNYLFEDSVFLSIFLTFLTLQPVIFLGFFLYIDRTLFRIGVGRFASKNLKKKSVKDEWKIGFKTRLLLSLPIYFCHFIIFTIYFSIVSF